MWAVFQDVQYVDIKNSKTVHDKYRKKKISDRG